MNGYHDIPIHYDGEVPWEGASAGLQGGAHHEREHGTSAWPCCTSKHENNIYTTLLETNISPKKRHFWRLLTFFPRWDMLVPYPKTQIYVYIYAGRLEKSSHGACNSFRLRLLPHSTGVFVTLELSRKTWQNACIPRSCQCGTLAAPPLPHHGWVEGFFPWKLTCSLKIDGWKM